MRVLFFILMAFTSLHAMSKGGGVHPEVAQNIGVRTEVYHDQGRGRPVTVEIWYPTHQSDPVDQADDSAWVHPKEIRDVPIAGGVFPLVLMSHGHRGDRRDRSWLAEYLVRNGFVVASVEHYGNSWKDYNPLLSLRFWERARDVSFAITKLFQHSVLRDHFHPHRIGFIGYSLGGMTGLALGGATAQNVKEVVMGQQQSYKEIDLELAQRIDFSDAHHSFLDRRIKALVLLSPATFVYQPESLKNITVPVALIASPGDEILPFKDHALKLIKHLMPAKLKILGARTSHYVFLNRVSEAGKKMFTEEMYTDEIEADRLVVHREVGQFIAAFLKENLR